MIFRMATHLNCSKVSNQEICLKLEISVLMSRNIAFFPSPPTSRLQQPIKMEFLLIFIKSMDGIRFTSLSQWLMKHFKIVFHFGLQPIRTFIGLMELWATSWIEQMCRTILSTSTTTTLLIFWNMMYFLVLRRQIHTWNQACEPSALFLILPSWEMQYATEIFNLLLITFTRKKLSKGNLLSIYLVFVKWKIQV